MDLSAAETAARAAFADVLDRIAEDEEFRELLKAEPGRALEALHDPRLEEVAAAARAHEPDAAADAAAEVAGFAKEELLEFPGVRIVGGMLGVPSSWGRPPSVRER